ncbi:MAG TPA: DUF1330 domain-containing protein, partial [Dehalococcoidia bacterium]
MAAYVIAQLQVDEVDTYNEYALAIGPTVAPFGGRLLVAANDATVLEGAQPYPRTVIGEFPTIEAARGWYDSPAYAEIRTKRIASARGAVFIVEGLT